jgi:mono/diheme cytochrome c family protein
MRVVTAIAVLFVLSMALLLVMHLDFLYWRRHKKPNLLTNQHPSIVSTTTNPPSAQPGGFYLGKGDNQVYVNYATHDPVLRSFMQSVMESGSDPNAKGREIFMKICAACHQRDGRGKDGVAPPLVGSEWVLAPGGGRLVRIVLNGLKGPVRVRGREWNLVMPPWRDNLDDDQLAVVLSFIRSELGSNHAEAITPEFVASVRQQPRTTPETSAELLRIPTGE